jgi:potassium-transporting ATPase KdpC subunit
MRAHLRPAFMLLLVFTALLGIAYPLATTGIAQLLFPSQAHGSLIAVDGRNVGSTLVGQAFPDSGWLVGRPAATSTPYDARSSAGSNLGPTSPTLDSLVRARAQQVREREGLAADQPVPVDLVTASGSGLDPHLSPASALLQVPRIARIRGIPEDSVRAVLARATSARTLGVFGEARVNVLYANLLLDGKSVERPGVF